MAPTFEDNYIITRDASESERLETQHGLYMQCQGYHFHPDIPLEPGSRVADLATGTAIFLREVAVTAGEGKLECHGFDISDAQFPPSGSPLLPANVQLHVADMKQPFEARWHGYFDAVHIRFVQAAMALDDWPLVLRNVVQLLRPGGWLQWAELDPQGLACFFPRAPPPDPSPEPPYYRKGREGMDPQPFRPVRNSAFADAAEFLMSPDRLKAMEFGFRNLESLFRDPHVGGLNDVFKDCYTTDSLPSIRKGMSRVAIAGFGGAMRLLEKHGERPIDFDEWRKRAEDEIEQGAFFSFRMANFIGRKS